MRFRTTLILLAILIILAAFVFLWERKQPAPMSAEATPPPTALPGLFAFVASDARSLRIARIDSGAQVEFAYRDTGLWHLTAPIAEVADQGRVTSFVQSLSWLTPTRALEGATNAADYDLNPGQLRIEVTLLDGTQHAIIYGAATPAGSGYYAQIEGDGRILIVNYALYSDATAFLSSPPVAPTATLTAAPAPTETPAQ